MERYLSPLVTTLKNQTALRVVRSKPVLTHKNIKVCLTTDNTPRRPSNLFREYTIGAGQMLHRYSWCQSNSPLKEHHTYGQAQT